MLLPHQEWSLLFAYTVAKEGLWIARKEGAGKLRMIVVSEVSKAKRPLVLTGLTPGQTPGVVL